jgi:hypothetical protein
MLILTSAFLILGRFGIWPLNVPHWGQPAPVALVGILQLGMTRNVIMIWLLGTLQIFLMNLLLRDGAVRCKMTQQFFASVWFVLSFLGARMAASHARCIACSHELRGPTQSIVNGTEMLLDSSLPVAHLEAVHAVADASVELVDLLNTILGMWYFLFCALACCAHHCAHADYEKLEFGLLRLERAAMHVRADICAIGEAALRTKLSPDRLSIVVRAAARVRLQCPWR